MRISSAKKPASYVGDKDELAELLLKKKKVSERYMKNLNVVSKIL